jgi:hypothetical protein
LSSGWINFWRWESMALSDMSKKPGWDRWSSTSITEIFLVTLHQC